MLSFWLNNWFLIKQFGLGRFRFGCLRPARACSAFLMLVFRVQQYSFWLNNWVLILNFRFGLR